MCGIAGIAKFDPTDVAEQPRLTRMRDILEHRGPDGEGLAIDGPVGLAHRRLAIIDPAAGQQPMTNEDGSVWIVFNGEIYNHLELRKGLEARGHRYRTRCDTETILHLYEEEGDKVVESLHGMFAFAIWDRNTKKLLLARDRLGIKPLYYACTPRELVFGSEIKAVLASGAVAGKFNETALPELLSSGFLSSQETMFVGVRKLLPGHILEWSARDGVRERRYWRLPAPVGGGASFGDRAEQLRSLLQSAVKRHLMSDVPIGVFLSGGLDSSVMAAMVAKETPDAVRTFSVGFADAEANELPYARMVAKHIGAQHRDVTVTPEQFFRTLPSLVWHEDEPIAFPSSVPLYFVSKLAREDVKVVLTGEGADELFLGYNRYRVTHWNARLGKIYWSLASRGLRDHIRRLIGGLPPRISRTIQRTFLALEPGIRHLYLENFSVVPEWMQRNLLQKPGLIDRYDPHAGQLRSFDEGSGDLLDRLSQLDLQTYLHELLMKQDQMSMAASIESRVPFLDDSLVDHVASMPAEFKLRGWETKAVLRAAVQDLLPKRILQRPKMGFPVPVGRWLRTDFQPLVSEFVLGPRAQARRLFNHAALRQLVNEHASGRVSHTDRLWLLINLEIWLRIFQDGEQPQTVISERLLYANSVGQSRRLVAADVGRPVAQPPDHIGVVDPAPSHAGHHARH
jgi:asparagine synthase (glutamine-hydrolysing)